MQLTKATACLIGTLTIPLQLSLFLSSSSSVYSSASSSSFFFFFFFSLSPPLSLPSFYPSLFYFTPASPPISVFLFSLSLCLNWYPSLSLLISLSFFVSLSLSMCLSLPSVVDKHRKGVHINNTCFWAPRWIEVIDRMLQSWAESFHVT